MYAAPVTLADSDIVGVLAEAWAIEVDRVEYAPVGFGSHHWHAWSGDERWFVTVDDLATRAEPGESYDVARDRLRGALSSSLALHEHGLEFVVAPIPSRTNGVVLERVDARFTISLFPWVVGVHHPYGNYPDDASRLAVVERLARLHAVPVDVVSHARTDDAALAHRGALERALVELHEPWNSGPFAEPARAALCDGAAAVRLALVEYDAGSSFVINAVRHVVTHGEPHSANTIDTGDGPVLIDWDTVLVAPPERDLWDLATEQQDVAAIYAAATGVTLDDRLLAWYRLRWDLSEVAVYVAEFRQPHVDDANTNTSWQNFTDYLAALRRRAMH